MYKNLSGTLAIDLGNTNTVIAFRGEREDETILLEIPKITISPGIVPTAIWHEKETNKTLIGMEAIEKKSFSNSEVYFHSNFKRLIGNPFEKFEKKVLNPEESGEKFLNLLWDNLPQELEIKRLVLTAPIDTYKGYRKWLTDICKELPIEEIALVDEPTAAGIGIDVPLGSRIMIIDIGGSTIDFNIIQLEGGEGKSAPIAELLKFNGNDVSGISKQKIRCAKIISKSGSKIGGKDIDQWIINHFIPINKDERNFLIAEKIKCKLSSRNIKSDIKYKVSFFCDEYQKKDFLISREVLDGILIKNNLLNHLNSLLKSLLNEARGKNCNKTDLHSIILVGGGTQIPLIKDWVSSYMPGISILSPPPVESIALGALSMTPGVKIKDILNKGISIRLFKKKEKKHFWYPIFFKGQTWPTEKPFELILQGSKNDQTIFEIIIGETKEKKDFDIIFENGLPKLSDVQTDEEIEKWEDNQTKIILKNPSILGEDCLKLLFWINKESILCMRCFDMNKNNLGEFNIGSIF